MPPTPHIIIIAEAGVNHNGSLERALELVEVARTSGADIVKFQTFRADRLASGNAPKAQYQETVTGTGESQQAMLKRLELDEAAHKTLLNRCHDRGIEFLSSPFDLESVDLLVHSLGLQRLKLSSGELTNAPLLLKIARFGVPVILSTGMATLGDIEAALGVLAFGYSYPATASPSEQSFQAAYASSAGRLSLEQKVVLLHCTTEYPAPYAEVHLRCLETMRQAFGLPVGFSDHTPGIAVSVAAAALGAVMIEKHFTLDKGLPGPDHQASLDPNELRQLVASVRVVEQALGQPEKHPQASELGNMQVARKSLVAAGPIAAGELFTPLNLTTKRPGNGISPMRYWDYLGKQAVQPYDKDALIS